MKAITVIGARPQFIKAAAVSRALAASGRVEEALLHTGQHYDDAMSRVFFEELDIPRPRFDLDIQAPSHGAMTGRMLEGTERILLEERPDWVLVYGDTNSTLAGALAAAKLHIPVVHVEAGLRSFDKRMPEEINRILTDRLATLLFCPTEAAAAHLAAEGIAAGVHVVGDVMYDLAIDYADRARARYDLAEWGVEEGNYALCTLHREANTHDLERLRAILCALRFIAAEIPLLLPLHPGTARRIQALDDCDALAGVRVLPPLGYLAMTRLEIGAETILTDSGGVQKEAFFHGVPCVTLREKTEWEETVAAGWNRLAGAETARILAAWQAMRNPPVGGKAERGAYGDGHAADRIAALLSGEGCQ